MVGVLPGRIGGQILATFKQRRMRFPELQRSPCDVELRPAVVQILKERARECGVGSAVRLQVGDIVPLEHSTEQPVTISVDGVTCNKAVTGRRGKRLACLVVDAPQEHNQ